MNTNIQQQQGSNGKSLSHRVFGQYMLVKKWLSHENLLEAYHYQSAVQRKFGDIAVEKNYLTRQDTEAIAKTQRTVDKRFGEIALSMGLLTAENIEEIRDLQLIDYISISLKLMELGFITEKELLSEFRHFKQEQNSKIIADVVMPEKAVMKQSSESLIMSVTKDVASRMLISMAGVHVKAAEIKIETGYTYNPYYCVIINTTGNIRGRFILKLSRELALVIVNRMMDMMIDENDEALIADAMGEFLNIIMGHVHSKLRQEGKYFTISPPYVHSNKDMTVISFDKKEKSYVLPLICNEGFAEMHWVEDTGAGSQASPAV
ncbi:MAG: chemotaxis protein CheX [Vulcanimicrobiota bacterium]